MFDAHAVSRTLSYWLRHAPEAGGFALDAEGWAHTDEVLAGLRSRFGDVDFDGLLRVVETNDKQRFEFSPDLARLRARQGHSVEVDLALSPRTPPTILYHGTSERFAAAIFAKGLLPMGRHHVHLSHDLETARRVGARRKEPIVLEVAAGRMHAAGHRFFVTGNRVWLVDRVPPEFLVRSGSGR